MIEHHHRSERKCGLIQLARSSRRYRARPPPTALRYASWAERPMLRLSAPDGVVAARRPLGQPQAGASTLPRRGLACAARPAVSCVAPARPRRCQCVNQRWSMDFQRWVGLGALVSSLTPGRRVHERMLGHQLTRRLTGVGTRGRRTRPSPATTDRSRAVEAWALAPGLHRTERF